LITPLPEASIAVVELELAEASDINHFLKSSTASRTTAATPMISQGELTPPPLPPKVIPPDLALDDALVAPPPPPLLSIEAYWL
jgi:hypothetical protein